VFGGLTFALVLGVPAGSLLEGSLGYRGVFALVAAVAVVVAVAARAALPRVDAPPAVSLRERFAGAADRRVQIVLAMTVLGVLATMSVYIYVVPLLDKTADLTGGVVSVLLLIYGLGAVVGNWVGGRATDRYGSLRTLTVAMVGFIVVVGTFDVTAVSVGGAAVALFVWSGFTWAFNPPVQNLLLELGSGGGLLLALNASAIYLGAGLSGIVGGVVINLLGVQALPPLGAVLGVIVLGLIMILRRHPELQEIEDLEEASVLAE